MVCIPRALRGSMSFCLITVLGTPTALAAGLDIEGGASVSLSSGSVDLGCNDLTTAGLLDIDSGAISAARHVGIATGGVVNGGQGSIGLSGDWTNDGSFNAGTGAISMADGCGVTVFTVAGDTTFNDLSITTASGRQVDFEAGSTQSVTGPVAFTGVSGNRLAIRSTTPGTPAFLDITTAAPQTFAHLDIQDNHVTGLQTVPPANSIDSGGTQGWFGIAQGIPTLSRGALLALALLLVLGVAWRRRPSIQPFA